MASNNLAYIKLRLLSLLVGLGIAALASLIIYAVAYYLFGIYSIGIIFGVFVLVLMMDLLQWFIGPYIVDMVYRAKKADPNRYGNIIAIVEEVAKLNGIRPPTLYISEVSFPNAFAYESPIAGRRIAITRPLLGILNEDELRAVIGHEIGHLKHHDSAVIMAIGLIPTLIFYFAYTTLFAGDRRNGGSAIILALVLMVVSFLFNIMVLSVNRLRESYADANAALTIPNGARNLQTALAKIVRYGSSAKNTAASMLLFANYDMDREDVETLIDKWRTMRVGILSDLFSDHPHPAKRIRLLDKLQDSS
ncbi:zinc metalloprotease HtpX [Thermoplasma volcanium]|nr:zinc metalloprotease HtpX [Thermoplasma volcanium]